MNVWRYRENPKFKMGTEKLISEMWKNEKFKMAIRSLCRRYSLKQAEETLLSDITNMFITEVLEDCENPETELYDSQIEDILRILSILESWV